MLDRFIPLDEIELGQDYTVKAKVQVHKSQMPHLYGVASSNAFAPDSRLETKRVSTSDREQIEKAYKKAIADRNKAEAYRLGEVLGQLK